MSAFDRRHDLAIDTATFMIAAQCARQEAITFLRGEGGAPKGLAEFLAS
jgi:hypothetical protein